MANIINPAGDSHKKMMKRIAEVTEVDSIIYEDLGEGENYILVKNGKRVVLKIRSNHVDGGYLSVE
jgi:hypothetical protein